MPVSPVTGRLDAFVWKEPLAELGAGAVIDSGDGPAEPVPSSADAPITADGGARNAAAPAIAPALEKAIPVLHAPDDPGPDAEPPVEPETEPPAPADGWTRLRQLFM